MRHKATEDSMENLKPCPFCGTNLCDFPEVMIIEKKRIRPDNYTITCIQCGATGGNAWSKKEATEKWNRREIN